MTPDRPETAGPVGPVIETVLGPITPDRLGAVMMHEHLGPRFHPSRSAGREEPEDPFARRMSREPVSLENLWWVHHNAQLSADNQVPPPDADWQVDMDMYAAVGGGTLVELTAGGSRGLDRVRAMSAASGVHVVTASGFYVDGTYPAELDMPSRTIDDLVRLMLAEIQDGDPVTGIRAGIIGELGCSWPLTADERKVLFAGAIAQQETGLSISIHPGRHDAAPGEICKVLDSAGADLTRVIMGHVDRRGYKPATVWGLLDAGMTIAYDGFGTEGYDPGNTAPTGVAVPTVLNDAGRIEQLARLSASGYGHQVVVGQDVHLKMHLTRYGGWGYGHLLRVVVPLMHLWGFTVDQIEALLVVNPQRLLTPAHWR